MCGEGWDSKQKTTYGNCRKIWYSEYIMELEKTRFLNKLHLGCQWIENQFWARATESMRRLSNEMTRSVKIIWRRKKLGSLYVNVLNSICLLVIQEEMSGRWWALQVGILVESWGKTLNSRVSYLWNIFKTNVMEEIAKRLMEKTRLTMSGTHQNGKKKTNHQIGLQNINSWVERKVENIAFSKPSEDNAAHKKEWAIAH